MRKAAAAALLVLLAAGPGRASLTRQTLSAASGAGVEMAYRALQPGEPLLLRYAGAGDTVRATVVLLGSTAVLNAPRPGTESFAFLGIDLGVKPGTYPLEVRFRRGNGSEEMIRSEITVVPRAFSETKLRIRPELVTPPPVMEKRIRQESQLVAMVLAVFTPRWLGDGAFAPPSPYDAFPNFGQRRLTNGVVNSVHAGVDLKVPYGEPIAAANAGRVALAANLYLSGKTVIIDHGLGVFSFYFHLSKLLVRHGTFVKKGAVIAKCGNSGRSTGPHLHWAVKIFDSRVDPYAMLELAAPSTVRAKEEAAAVR